MDAYPDDIRQRTFRREVVRVAVGENHRFADHGQIEQASLRDDALELWLPHGIKLVDLVPPRPMLAVNAVWRQEQELPVLGRFFESVKRLAEECHWV